MISPVRPFVPFRPLDGPALFCCLSEGFLFAFLVVFSIGIALALITEFIAWPFVRLASFNWHQYPSL
jgi:hypothetical protein